MLKAQLLMAAHNLSMEQVTAVRPEEGDAVVEKTAQKPNRTIQYWQKLLTSVITGNFRCTCVYRSYRNGTRDIVIIGMPEDVEACRETLAFAFQSAKNCWERYRKTRTYRNRRTTESAKKDYMIGFAVGLRDAFAAQVKEKALVLVRSSKIDDYVSNMRLRSEPGVRRNRRVDRHAQQSGYEEGRRGRGGLIEEG